MKEMKAQQLQWCCWSHTEPPRARGMSERAGAAHAHPDANDASVIEVRLHVGGSFAGSVPHVYVSFAYRMTHPLTRRSRSRRESAREGECQQVLYGGSRVGQTLEEV